MLTKEKSKQKRKSVNNQNNFYVEKQIKGPEFFFFQLFLS